METIKDIKRILWHEMGHFFIDLLEIKINGNFYVENIWISYVKDATSDHKWAGGVKTLPEIKWEAIVKDIEKTSFTLLNLISGCLFQTYFLKEVLKENVNFYDCFCFHNSCAGGGDIRKFHKIINLIRDIYGENLSLRIFLEKELIEAYYMNFLKSKIFLNSTNELVNRYSNTILEKFTQYEDKFKFHYSFKENRMESLKAEAKTILNKSSFELDILALKEKIKQNIHSKKNN